MKNNTDKTPQKFEEALERLEGIIRLMEEGNLPLEEALDSFEDGMKLVRFLQAKLDEAQKRVEILLKDEQGNLKAEPFAGAE